MSHIVLQVASTEFSRELVSSQKIFSCTESWVNFHFPSNSAKFTRRHQYMLVERAFMMAFMAWEEFLEETCILYLLGKKPPKGKRLYSQLPVKTRRHAKKFLLQGKKYVDWAPTRHIFEHNKRIFEDHENTYFNQLSNVRQKLDEICDIRNAIAHRSEHSWEIFKTIVRNRLSGAYPPNLPVGGFLIMDIPHSSPPSTFLEDYIDELQFAASLVVPQ